MTKERELKEAVREGRDRVSVFTCFCLAPSIVRDCSACMISGFIVLKMA